MAERSTDQIETQAPTTSELAEHTAALELLAAETTLNDLAAVFFKDELARSAPAASVPDAPLTIEARLRTLLDQMPAVVFMAYLDQGIGHAYVSPQIEAMLGYSQAEWLEDPLRWYEHIHPDDKQRWSVEASEMFLSGQPLKSAYRVMSRDGRVVWFQCEAKMVRREDGRPWYIHGVGFDVTRLKVAQEKLEHDAFHDSLTNLPNRALFLDRLDRAVARSKRHKDYSYAVLFVDIDRFKIVNDSLGRPAGDELILQASHRILNSLRLEDVISRASKKVERDEWTAKDDTLACLGGDEFTVLLDDLRSPTDSIRVAGRIQQAFVAPFIIDGQELFVTASIGIAASSEIYLAATEVLRDADLATRRAKTLGYSQVEVFDQGLHQQAVGRLKLETDLRRALEREEFRVFYQPIVSLKTDAIAGFEALVRWQRPDVGLVAPGAFIGTAEDMGLIVPLGNWVLKTACEQARRWHIEHPRERPLTMSVNVSGRQFMKPDIVEQIGQILRATQVDPAAIKLEITESVTMGDAERTTNVLKGLKNLGVRLSIDDFGTGYSSLSYLQRFPADTLKIDRSFVHNLATSPENVEIVRTIVGLARNLGMDIIAEGPETSGEIDLLKALACDYAQGYFYSKPVDRENAEALLSKNFSIPK